MKIKTLLPIVLVFAAPAEAALTITASVDAVYSADLYTGHERIVAQDHDEGSGAIAALLDENKPDSRVGAAVYANAGLQRLQGGVAAYDRVGLPWISVNGNFGINYTYVNDTSRQVHSYLDFNINYLNLTASHARQQSGMSVGVIKYLNGRYIAISQLYSVSLDGSSLSQSYRAADGLVCSNFPHTTGAFCYGGTVRGAFDAGILDVGDTLGLTYYISMAAGFNGETWLVRQVDASMVSNSDFRVESAASDVPEPGSWMMIMAGFGLLGGILRRRSFVPNSG